MMRKTRKIRLVVKIPLTNGGFALVDDADAVLIQGINWWRHDHKDRNVSYAVNRGRAMHRVILGLRKGDGVHTDHGDGNGLNNQRYNLSATTCSRNQVNRRKARSSTGYQGIYWDRFQKRFKVMTKRDRKLIWLGSAKTLNEAIEVYQHGFKRVWGTGVPFSYNKQEKPTISSLMTTGTATAPGDSPGNHRSGPGDMA